VFDLKPASRAIFTQNRRSQRAGNLTDPITPDTDEVIIGGYPRGLSVATLRGGYLQRPGSSRDDSVPRGRISRSRPIQARRVDEREFVTGGEAGRDTAAGLNQRSFGVVRQDTESGFSHALWRFE